MPGSVRGAHGATGRQVCRELALLSPPPAPPFEFRGWVEGQGTGSQEENRMQSGPEIGQPQMLSGISSVWVLNEAHQNPAFHSSLLSTGTKSRNRLDCPIVPVASNFGRAGLGGGGRAAVSGVFQHHVLPRSPASCSVGSQESLTQRDSALGLLIASDRNPSADTAHSFTINFD